MTHDITIRLATSADLPQINAIYNHYVTHSTCVWTTTACSEAERQAWYEAHDTTMPVLVACDQRTGRVVGWSALSSFRPAYTLAGTLEDSVYVHHGYHRQGIGTRLLVELVGTARRQGLRSILANISADQEPSIRLHEKLGFRKAAHLQQVGCKFGRQFDAVYLQLMLTDPSTGTTPPIALGLVPATEVDFPIVTNLSRFYIYDMSAYMGWACPENGLFGGCDEFFDDWRAGKTHPYLLRLGGELAGFAAVKPMDAPDTFSIQEFFVLAKFRRKGVGRRVAQELFAHHPGHWQIEQLMDNTPAVHFWRRVIADHTAGQYAEHVRQSPWGPMNVIEFASLNRAPAPELKL